MFEMQLDVLSPLAHQILNANPRAYERLVVRDGTPAEARKLLDGVEPRQLVANPATASAHATAMLAGLWLWHDGLDECHRIAQQSPEDAMVNSGNLRQATSTLSFWHAIMHRREGDFSNSKYWYARAGTHPALAALANQAGSIVHSQLADNSLLRVIASGWNAAAFVDLVESLDGHPEDPRHPLAVQLQQLEWKALFETSARA